MNSRYVVFVSSTSKDLQAERELVMRGLLSANCMPAGMEQFPAGNDETFEYIKKVIVDCDYYLLILAGKYGTESPDGRSYTEKEYDFALEKGIPIIALLCQDPDLLPGHRSEKNAAQKRKLSHFRDKVSHGRIVNYWKNENELVTKVIASLHHAIDNHPRPGLVRGARDRIKLFPSSAAQNDYFVERIKSAKLVKDLTWARFRFRSDSQYDVQLEASESTHQQRLIETSLSNTVYDEIFIFADGQKLRPDRLEKLRLCYEYVKAGRYPHYSCAYYESVDFPRLQFTIIDHNEILFTSGQNIRCAVFDEGLAEVFAKYFEQAWSMATVLIDDGKPVNPKIIEALLAQQVSS